MEELTNLEKFELLEIDIAKLRQDIRKEISIEELCVLSDDELNSIQNIIGESIELEIEPEEPVENTRASFLKKNKQIVVIKAKALDTKLLFYLLGSAGGFINGTKLTRAYILIDVLFKVFYQMVDKESSEVYTYLADEQFSHGRKFNNIEIFDAVSQYIKESMGVQWSNQKIQEKLDKLEKELRVIECIDGVYKVNDKIHFA